MALTGLTSITFRQYPPEKIISLAKSAGLDGIEWGGDIHVPPGELEAAGRVAAQTLEAGLETLSYGSYYRLCQGEDFSPILETAACLGAPNIRIWAGNCRPAEAGRAYRQSAAVELRSLCAAAEQRSITISLEYHRQTLTETAESAWELLTNAGADNLRTYWQPNPDISYTENSRELRRMLPFLSSIHVFQWKEANVRYPLSEGEAEWRDYISIAGKERPYLLEFVREDSPEQFALDAQVLKDWLGQPEIK